MTLTPFETRRAGEAARLYHELALLSPCCLPIDAATLADALAGGDRPTLALTADDGGELVGLLHVELAPEPEAEGPRVAAIRMLSYRPGYRPVGQTLVEAAERFAREHRADRLVAFDPDFRYRFWHLFCGGLTDRALHLHGVLSLNGFQRAGGEVFLQWDPPVWPAPRNPLPNGVRIEVDVQPGAGIRPGLHVRAMLDGAQIGECLCKSAAECVPGGAAEAIGFVKWLGLEEAHRGGGLGANLLARALAELVALGYPSIIISTSWLNYRAQAFYANFGARVIDWTWWAAKSLADPADDAG